MKDTKLNNFLVCLVYATVLLLYILIATRGEFFFSSTLDHTSQHVAIADYFRQLFYQTGELFPDFTPHFGSGQNIYYLSYYGLFNPFILFSYLLPNVEMIIYIQFLMYFVVLSSSILLFFYIKKERSILVAAICGFLFLSATPMTYHMHRHIMFINYMPFLIMGLYGIDKYIKTNKSYLLLISLALILFTSFYYAVGSFVVLFLYGIYRYLKLTKETEYKTIFRWSLKFIVPFALAGFISAVLIFPTAYALLAGRQDSSVSINIFTLLIPIPYILYTPYSIGLTISSVIFLFIAINKAEKLDFYFTAIILVIVMNPIFALILNGFIYADGKAYIPFLPIIIILLSGGVSHCFDKQLEKKDFKRLVYVALSCLIVVTISNTIEFYKDKDEYRYETSINERLYDTIEDDSYFRINNSYLSYYNMNEIYNMKEYKTTMYSSISNTGYQNFYYNTFNNNINNVTSFKINSTSNILSQMYFGEKYIYSEYELGMGYQFVDKVEDVYVYEILNVLPVGYATNRYININDFNKLTNLEQQINLLGNIVTDKYQTNVNLLKPTTHNVNEFVNVDNSKFTFKNNLYSNVEKELKLDLNYDTTGKLVVLSFDIEDSLMEQEIVINNQKNILSQSFWKYYNNNTNFQYVFAEPTEFNIKTSGKHKFSNIKIETIEYSDIINNVSTVTPFDFNIEKTIGDKISGTIEVNEDSYFTLSIPYEEGFKIYVNNELVECEKINNTFIGVYLKEGVNSIEIEYVAPLKDISLKITIVTVVISVIYCIVERKKVWKQSQ